MIENCEVTTLLLLSNENENSHSHWSFLKSLWQSSPSGIKHF